MWVDKDFEARNRAIFDEELDDFIPRRVLDFHVHVWNEASMPANGTWNCGGVPIRKYDYDDLQRDLDVAYPGRETLAVCFGLPEVQLDKACNDAYVANSPDPERFFPLRLIDPHETDHAAIERDVLQSGFWGFKPYLNYVRKADPNQVEIPEMLPDPVMEIADRHGLVVMLHIPRAARLADPLNQRQLVELCQGYPNAKIILAHIGRAYFLRNIVGHLEPLLELPNLYYDLAMVHHWEVMEYLFRRAPAERILYGTDIPIALPPGISVEINHHYTYITPEPWALSISDDHGRLVFTSFLYEELRGIKKAVERLGLSREWVQGLFFDNGMRLLEGIARTKG